jgi:putative permease
MDLHPVTILLAVLALGSRFGFLGALLATPFMGMLVAYYQEFYLAKQEYDPHLSERVEQMLKREVNE